MTMPRGSARDSSVAFQHLLLIMTRATINQTEHKRPALQVSQSVPASLVSLRVTQASVSFSHVLCLS